MIVKNVFLNKSIKKKIFYWLQWWSLYKLARPNLHVYVSISQLIIHVKSEYLYLYICIWIYIFRGTDKKVFLESLIQQKNIFMNSMAASLQNGRPNIFDCQYLG